jgi:MFS family permease
MSLTADQMGLGLLKPLAKRNFLLLWVGEGISLIGDQFYLIAIGFITMQITGSAFALGTVMMTAAIPRAVLMLLGGAITDRFSPRSVMMVSNALRSGITVTLAALAFSSSLQVWQLYILAASFGVVDAFFYPAYASMTPVLVSTEELQAANGIMYGTLQLAQLVGPALAGLLIAASSASYAFVVDAATFVFAAFTLTLMVGVQRTAPTRTEPTVVTGPKIHGISFGKSTSLLTEIREGLSYVIKHPFLGAVLGVIAATHFAIDAPVYVGATTLATQRFALSGASGMGIMLSAWGGGALVGALIAGIRSMKRNGRTVLGLAALLGVLFVILGYLPDARLATIDLAVMGIANGIWSVVGIAWVQKVVASDMRGRAMSVLMLASAGVMPFSYALAGWLADINLTLMFNAAGAIIVAMSLYAGTNRALRAAE